MISGEKTKISQKSEEKEDRRAKIDITNNILEIDKELNKENIVRKT